MSRFQKMRRQLEQGYERLIIATPSSVDPSDLDRVRALAEMPHISVVISPEPAWSRYLALQKSLEIPADYVHYADMDRLLHWVETRPLEWRQTVEAIQKSECLIIGRTEQALQTHPQALQQTEKIINTLFSHLLGQPVDLGGGSRGFSRRSVEYLITHSSPGSWVDAEWPMLLHQAGFRLDYLAVEGLDWESADRYRSQATDTETRRHLAEAYDDDPKHWAVRVKIALDIIQAGLSVLN
jgi:hypothetical protein